MLTLCILTCRLGEEWGEKKSICNRFEVSAPVTSVAWLTSRPDTVFFGSTDGKVGSVERFQ